MQGRRRTASDPSRRAHQPHERRADAVDVFLEFDQQVVAE